MTTRSVSLGKSSSPTRSVVAGLLGAIARLWRAWTARRQVMGLLEADDRMLADIGLTRSDVVGSLELPLDADPSHHLIRARTERMTGRARHRRTS